jgi:predicted DNA-binding transcriptional regulator YafY
MPNTATRLIHLIQLLQHTPGQKAAGLAEELGVSMRTVHRYFSMLDEMGIPIYSERGPHGGFSLVRGYKMPPLIFSPEEAVAVSLGTSLVEEMWGQLYRDAARSALAKLENLLPDEQRMEAAWAQRTLVATGIHRADVEALSPILEKLRRAARERRRVRMAYHSSGRIEPEQREIDPYTLIHRWGWWYVIGFCHLRQAERTFRMDRIKSLSLLETLFEVPEDFDLQEYMQKEMQAQPQLLVRLRFLPSGSHIAKESPFGWEALEEQPDGSLIASFNTPTLEWAASTALSYGPLVEVLEPLELRAMLKEWISEITNYYCAD